MKWLPALLFSSLTLIGILKDLSVFISFKANQEYIVMTMCTGADELINTCNGSCYLTNQLELIHNHDQESEQQAPSNLKNNITYYYEEIPVSLKPEFKLTPVIRMCNSKSEALRGHPLAIYQPPKYS